MPCNGHVINNTPIAVDIWQKDQCPQARLFFLSHFHTDHTVGLTRSWDLPIYTSEVTGQLLIEIIGVNPSLIKSLEFEEPHLLSLDNENREMLSVTLFNANHCPGSVSFLFQGYFGNIFYTGDFRYAPNLFPLSLFPVIDMLYLDNTYCSPKCDFPIREAAIDALLNEVHGCLRHSKHVVLGLDNLGKEEFLEKIARESHTKLCVTTQKQKILHILGIKDDILTNEKEKAKISIVPTNQISSFNVERWNNEVPTCAILATAKFCGYNFQPFRCNKKVHVIPLSNHSSYKELVEFVRQIRPRRVIPILGLNARGIFNTDISDRADMRCFSSYLNSSPPRTYTIPKTVENAMASWRQNSQPTVALIRHQTSTPVTRKTPVRTVRGVSFISESDDSESSSGIVDDPGLPARKIVRKDRLSMESSDATVSDLLDVSLTPINRSSDSSSSESGFAWQVVHVTARKK